MGRILGSTDTETSEGEVPSEGETDNQFPEEMRTVAVYRVAAPPAVTLNICGDGFVLPTRWEKAKEVGDTASEVGEVTVRVTGILICPAVCDWMESEPV